MCLSCVLVCVCVCVFFSWLLSVLMSITLYSHCLLLWMSAACSHYRWVFSPNRDMMQQKFACFPCALTSLITRRDHQGVVHRVKPVIGQKQENRFQLSSLLSSPLRSSTSCKFIFWSACFCSSQQQQCPNHLHHLLLLHHNLLLLLHHARHQSAQCSRARPQPALQLRGNHHQHHKAGLHRWVVSNGVSLQT